MDVVMAIVVVWSGFFCAFIGYLGWLHFSGLQMCVRCYRRVKESELVESEEHGGQVCVDGCVTPQGRTQTATAH